MKSISKLWMTRASGVFHVLFLSYITWHVAYSPVVLLLGCMMLAAVLIELGRFEWVQWRLRRARRERAST